MELDLTHQTQIYLGLFERELYGWLGRLLQGVNTAIDIGTGEGEYTLYFLAKTSAKKVFAFEPSEKNRAQLITNLNLNGLSESPRLVISSKFVGRFENQDQCTLDGLIPSISPPCLIKIDVDGGEAEILRGASRLLELPLNRWIIETHSKDLEEECLEILWGARLRTVIVPNAWWRLFVPELRPARQNRWLVAMRNSVQ